MFHLEAIDRARMIFAGGAIMPAIDRLQVFRLNTASKDVTSWCSVYASCPWAFHSAIVETGPGCGGLARTFFIVGFVVKRFSTI